MVLLGCVWHQFYPQKLSGPTEETFNIKILWDGASTENLPTRRLVLNNLHLPNLKGGSTVMSLEMDDCYRDLTLQLY